MMSSVVNNAHLSAMRARRLKGHGAPCEWLHRCLWGICIVSTPNTQLTALPIVFLLSPSHIASYDTAPLHVLLQGASDTCNGAGVQRRIVLTWVVGKMQNRQCQCLVVWWKGNKTRAIKNNWNMNSHHSTNVSSILVAHIGPPRSKGERALIPFLFPPCWLCKSSCSSCEMRMYSP